MHDGAPAKPGSESGLLRRMALCAAVFAVARLWVEVTPLLPGM
jgi:hypothetical protein